VRALEKFGLRTAAIHGNKSQGARTKALKDFKTGKVTILVATDIAARGLDIDQLPVVVNFDLPMVAEDYIHRIGRTGRAGAEGLAISLVSQDETGLLRDIRRMLKQEIAINPVAGFEPSQPLRLEGPGSNGRPTFGKPKTHARRPHAHAPSNSHAAAKKQHRECAAIATRARLELEEAAEKPLSLRERGWGEGREFINVERDPTLIRPFGPPSPEGRRKRYLFAYRSLIRRSHQYFVDVDVRRLRNAVQHRIGDYPPAAIAALTTPRY
jgi:superfamily II DNA/RNA helicase